MVGQPGSDPAGEGARTGWALGLAAYAVEVIAVGFLALLFGGLSAMLADTCFRGSPELICEPRWQSILALTPITALVVIVVIMAVLLLWRRRFRLLLLAMVLTPLVPLVAFLAVQAVVTA